MSRPIAIDLFAGAGGLSLGFEQAGFDVVAAVEIDPIHCAVHKFNFPQTAIIPRSVVNLKGIDIRKEAGIGSQNIDCVFGGPPCQGFSLMGQRSLEDPRNGLVLDFVRLVAELDASTFVFENVKGLTVGKQRRFLSELIAAFDEVGYSIRLPWQVLNSANYGVPQDRQRLILIGSKKGKNPPNYPIPITTRADDHLLIDLLPKGPTCFDAIEDLPNAEDFIELNETDSKLVSNYGEPSNYAAELRCQTKDAWHFGYRRIWDSQLLTSSMRTTHTDISKLRFKQTKPGEIEPISRFFKLSPTGLSNTLRAGTDSARGAFTSPRPIHYKYSRCITVREMARLHGFPDWFRFHCTKWHGARQIGNAVTPPMARAIAGSILESLGISPTHPQQLLELGDLKLLEANMSTASKLFYVHSPIQKRNRKTGVKKRKQSDIEKERLGSKAA
jgi:DNA (cytosine-5)-methyltransferase 1